MKKETPKKEPIDLSYYLTLFTLEGHTTWRCALHTKIDGFDLERTKEPGSVAPKVTAKHVIKIDRITGAIIPL